MIYIIRHGETDWNVEGRYAGRMNIPLNKKGIEQARKLKEKFKNIKIDIVITSPLIRAIQTADEIVNNEKIIDYRIIERSKGELEGKLKSEITWKIDFNNSNEKKYNIESIDEFRKRIYDFLNEIKEKYKGKNVLIVTHAGVCLYIREYFEGKPSSGNYSEYKLKNCECLKYKNM